MIMGMPGELRTAWAVTDTCNQSSNRVSLGHPCRRCYRLSRLVTSLGLPTHRHRGFPNHLIWHAYTKPATAFTSSIYSGSTRHRITPQYLQRKVIKDPVYAIILPCSRELVAPCRAQNLAPSPWGTNVTAPSVYGIWCVPFNTLSELTTVHRCSLLGSKLNMTLSTFPSFFPLNTHVYATCDCRHGVFLYLRFRSFFLYHAFFRQLQQMVVLAIFKRSWNRSFPNARCSFLVAN